MKLPSFQFYPGDWMKDPNLRRCSRAARGMWMDMLCLMFECEDRGVLSTGGVPWSDQEIAAATTGDIPEGLECFAELLRRGVARRNESGAVFCKRMVRDQQIRQIRQMAGKKGGEVRRKQFCLGKIEANAKQTPEDEGEGYWEGTGKKRGAGEGRGAREGPNLIAEVDFIKSTLFPLFGKRVTLVLDGVASQWASTLASRADLHQEILEICWFYKNGEKPPQSFERLAEKWEETLQRAYVLRTRNGKPKPLALKILDGI